MEYIQILKDRIANIHLTREEWGIIAVAAAVFIIIEGVMLVRRKKG